MVESTGIQFHTKGHCDIVDITREVNRAVAESRVESGIVTLFVTGSTGAISTIEAEGALLSDFQALWDKLVPRNVPYKHDRTWGDGNGHSHLRASLLGASLTIPFNNKRLALGTWQQIVFVDFDNRPRHRQLAVQIIGD